jgi:hypothetical protein
VKGNRDAVPRLYCDQCGKWAWANRSLAKKERQRIGGGGVMSLYPCPHGLGIHIGHVPQDVRNGALDKTDYLDRLN